MPLEMPLEMGRLTCLQTLPAFSVGEGRGLRIEELGNLKNLKGQLVICNLEQVSSKEEARRADLSRKASVFQLAFHWRRSEEDDSIKYEEVLEGLQPHPNLKCLTILFFDGYKFPSWVMKMAVRINGESSSLLPLDNLVNIKLSCCNRCEKIPMLGQLQHLRDLELSEMDNVKCIDDLFYGRNDNESSSSGGGNLTTTLFPSLKTLKLLWMGELEEWKEAAGAGVLVEVFPCLEELTISWCHKLTTAPSHFPCLKEFRIEGVHSSLPLTKICVNLTTLTALSIHDMSELTCLLDGLLPNNKCLEKLLISSCSMLTHIVPHVRGCDSYLRSLDINECEKLSNLPDDLHTLSSLKTLGVYSCYNLISFPDLQGLHSLSDLVISDCYKLTCLPEGLGCLTRLNKLEIGPFSKELNSFPSLDGIQHLSVSLRYLTIGGWPHFDTLPEQLQHFTALEDMLLFGFGVEALPEWFGNLSSLERLYLGSFEKLKYLPEAMRRLTKLRGLCISNSPLLKESCIQQSGPEWSKISHIPQIHWTDISNFV
uniref:Putative disease resistance protein RGA3 n=1 Tax=Davidia involucrata TaxID=16924 RepID=A0A5B7BJU5_DAVIN